MGFGSVLASILDALGLGYNALQNVATAKAVQEYIQKQMDKAATGNQIDSNNKRLQQLQKALDELNNVRQATLGGKAKQIVEKAIDEKSRAYNNVAIRSSRLERDQANQDQADYARMAYAGNMPLHSLGIIESNISGGN